jgi:hypothetical protein
MITQKNLVAILNTELKIKKIEEEMRLATLQLGEEKKRLLEKVKKAKEEILRRVDEEKESVEDGKHFLRVKEKMPKNTISWKDAYQELFICLVPGERFENEEKRLKAENAKNLTPYKELVIV